MGLPPPTDGNNTQLVVAIQCYTNGLSLRALVKCMKRQTSWAHGRTTQLMAGIYQLALNIIARTDAT